MKKKFQKSIFKLTFKFIFLFSITESDFVPFLSPVSFTASVLYILQSSTWDRMPYSQESPTQLSLSIALVQRLLFSRPLTFLFAFSLIGVTVVADAEWFPDSEQSCSG